MKVHIEGYCEFVYYKDGSLWYQTQNTKLIFPVPISDVGNATFAREEKGILMMRYIRKWLNTLTENKS